MGVDPAIRRSPRQLAGSLRLGSPYWFSTVVLGTAPSLAANRAPLRQATARRVEPKWTRTSTVASTLPASVGRSAADDALELSVASQFQLCRSGSPRTGCA